MLPGVTQAVTTDESVASLIMICDALVDIRTYQSLGVINDRSVAVVAFFRLLFNVKWNQSCFWVFLYYAKWINHSSHI